MDSKSQIGTHVLYLGLHNHKEIWAFESYPIESVIKELEQTLALKQEITEKESSEKQVTPIKKGRRKKNVL